MAYGSITKKDLFSLQNQKILILLLQRKEEGKRGESHAASNCVLRHLATK